MYGKSENIPKYTGFLIAGTLIIVGLSNLIFNLFFFQGDNLLWFFLGPLIQTFLFTGVFISAHEAMHGLVWPGNKIINRIVGWIAVILYAMFDYSKLYSAHHRHHANPGSATDPDFREPENAAYWKWYFRFMRQYLSLWQLLLMAVIFNLLQYGFNIPVHELLLFWVVPALLSTHQLFFFGTYLPHKPGKTIFKDKHNARSNEFPVWLSFLTCYHFGYHHEHHLAPNIPWWQLPAYNRQLNQKFTS
jgi:beta-carotene ketolase (CrtW type)